MVRNQVYRVTKEEMKDIKKELVKDEAMFIVELDGKEIHTEKDFFTKTWDVFGFPPAERPSWDGFNDWVRDPFFYKGEKCSLVMYNSSLFLDSDKEAKKTWLYFLFNYILPHWEDEIERTMTWAKKKQYNIYFVD